MLGDCENAKQRWGGVHELIDRWLKERQQLIVSYCALSGADASQSQALFEQLAELCQLMLDYISAGHFEVYEQLINEARDFNDGGLEMAKRVYPRISKTTQEMLAFNDLLDISEANEDDMRAMLGRVSYLGELMEERFELEDLLIETLHNVHADHVA